MPDVIKDGKGQGYWAGVNKNNQLLVKAETEQIQHVQSFRDEQAYQVFSNATLSSGLTTCIHMKNISTKRDIVITYIRHQIVDEAGGTAFPNASNYMYPAFDRVYDSSGSLLTPVNMNNGSGNEAEVIVYGVNPVLTGTARIWDRWYTKSEGDMNVWNKEGAVVIQPNKTVEFTYSGDQTSGTIYTRVSFIMKEI